MKHLMNISQQKIASENVNTVNARELHGFLKSKADFSTWMKKRIDDYGFAEGLDFVRLHNKMEANNATRIDYFISLDMAKEISMVERNEKGREARKYFIQCEKVAKNGTPADLNNPAQLRGILGDYVERVIELEAKIETDKPKMQEFDRFLNADGLYGLQNAARAMGAKPNLFARWLKEEYLFYQGNALVAKARYIYIDISQVLFYVCSTCFRQCGLIHL